jgi:hypothetical protein
MHKYAQYRAEDPNNSHEIRLTPEDIAVVLLAGLLVLGTVATIAYNKEPESDRGRDHLDRIKNLPVPALSTSIKAPKNNNIILS